VTLEAVVWTILVAAGSASRFGRDKLAEVVVHDRSVLDVAISAASESSTGVVVVCTPGTDMPTDPRRELVYVVGGRTRSESVRCGLAAVPERADVVVVHDAARPLADRSVYGRVIEAVSAGHDGAVPVVDVVDTIRSVDGRVVDREQLRAVQTPQAFRASVLREAHAPGGEATDDAGLVEAAGGEIVLVDGDVRNLKITRPADLVMVRAFLHEIL